MNRLVNYAIATTNAWQEVALGVEQSIFGLEIQLRSAASVDVSFNGGTTYWTVKSGASKTFAWTAPRNATVLSVRGTDGTVVEVDIKTQP